MTFIICKTYNIFSLMPRYHRTGWYEEVKCSVCCGRCVCVCLLSVRVCVIRIRLRANSIALSCTSFLDNCAEKDLDLKFNERMNFRNSCDFEITRTSLPRRILSSRAAPLHSKWHQSACAGTSPGDANFAYFLMRASRQTAKGPRPTHSGPQGKSDLLSTEG